MKPVFPYPGGKSKLLKSILPFIPRAGTQTYVEPFAGGLAVLLAHAKPFPREIANDLDGGMINFYRVAARHPEALIVELGGFFASREAFENELRFPLERTELGRAASWYWLQRQSFGGQRQHFGRGQDGFRGINLARDAETLRAFSRRACSVEFTNRDACDVIRAADSAGTFFFVDPPYIACSETAYAAFSESGMERLRDVLAACKGKWLLTCDDSPATRRVFAGFSARENKIRYSLAKDKAGKISGELMIFSDNLAADFPGETALLAPIREENSAPGLLFGNFF